MKNSCNWHSVVFGIQTLKVNGPVGNMTFCAYSLMYVKDLHTEMINEMFPISDKNFSSNGREQQVEYVIPYSDEDKYSKGLMSALGIN